MDFSELAPYIKKAFLSSNPQVQQSAMQINQRLEHNDDPDAETADDDIVDLAPNKENDDNIEGQMIDAGFKELEVEEAIEREEKNKALGDTQNAGFNLQFSKQSSIKESRVTYWDKLKMRYERDNSRKNSS